MPIKKSALLVMVITAVSFSLLVLSSAKTLPVTAPVQSSQLKCPGQQIETPVFSSWDIFSHLVFRPTA